MDPVTWFYIIMLLISLAVSIAMRPKPQNAKPPVLGDFTVPTAEEGRDIQVIFGEVWIEDPNVLWYGDLRMFPIKADGGK